MPYSTLRLCAGGGAYEAIPNPRVALDLVRIRSVLESRAIPVVDARVMLIARMESEVTVSRDGRILIKTRDPALAEQLFTDLRRWLELPAVSAGG